METSAVPSTYMPRELQIPDGFDVVLKDFTREILRAQPEDIHRFAADYFAQQCEGAASGDADPAAALARMGPDEIRGLIRDLFIENDKDESGYLDRREFKGVFSQLQDTLGLDRRVVERILAEADTNDDGAIQYEEFVPVASSIIESIVAKYNLREEEKLEDQAYADAEYEIYHGMPREQLDGILSKIFVKADKDKSGTLDPKEFESCLKSTELGLTRREINLLMMEADQDLGGTIDYAEFKPLCMKILVELAAQDWINEHKPKEEQEVAAFLTDLFRSADLQGTGLLSPADIMALLLSADLGLTRIQACSILSEASVSEDGMVEHEEFIPKVATMVLTLLQYKGNATTMEPRWDMADVEDRLAGAHPNPEQFRETWEPDEFSLAQITAMIQDAIPELELKIVGQLAQLAFPCDGGGDDILYSYSSVVDSAYWALVQFDELGAQF